MSSGDEKRRPETASRGAGPGADADEGRALTARATAPKPGSLSRRAFLGTGAATALAGGLAPALARTAPAARDEEAVLGPGPVEVELEVDGRPRRLSVEPRVTLLDALRDRLDVTGPKKVCDRGTCGACTVLEDGKPIYACTRLAIESAGRKIVTVEGLGTVASPHPIQSAFVENDAQQCGFCTPGFVVAIHALLERNPSPSGAEIDRALGGNLCRCGTYGGMGRALEALGARPGSRGGRRG